MNSEKNIVNFIAIDGDDVGNQIRNYIINNDVDSVASYSKALTSFFNNLADSMIKEGFKVVFCGGDSILAFASPSTTANYLSDIKKPEHPISIGVAPTAELAYVALQLAKARGKSRIVILENTKAETFLTWS